MRLESLLGILNNNNKQNRTEEEEDLPKIHTLDEFLNRIADENLNLVRAIVEKTPFVEDRVKKTVYFATFIASNNQTGIRYVEIYGVIPEIERKTEKELDKLIEITGRSILTAHHRLKAIKLRVPHVSTALINPVTGQNLEEEDMENIRKQMRQHRLPPMPYII